MLLLHRKYFPYDCKKAIKLIADSEIYDIQLEKIIFMLNHILMN